MTAEGTTCPMCGASMQATCTVRWTVVGGAWVPTEATVDDAIVECPNGCPDWAMGGVQVRRMAQEFAQAVATLSEQIAPQHPSFAPPPPRQHAASSGGGATIVPFRPR